MKAFILDLKDITKSGLSDNYFLLKASESANIEEIKKLIKKKVDVNCRDFSGNTPLILASMVYKKSIDTKILELLLNNGANIDAQNNTGNTALNEAVKESGRSSNIKIVKYLLDRGANINIVNELGGSPLISCAISTNLYSSLDTLKLLLKNKKINIDQRDINGHTALAVASINSRGNSSDDAVDLLIKYGADVNSTLNDKIDKKIFEYFKENINKNMYDENYGLSILMMCASTTNNRIKRSKNSTIMKLLNAGADINKKNIKGESALMIAINNFETSKISTIQLLIENGADIYSKNNNGDTILMTVLLNIDKKGMYENFDILIKKGVNINDLNNDGYSALYYAVHKTDLYTTKVLLSNDADKDLKFDDNKTLLMSLCADNHTKNHCEIIKLFILYGADTNIQDDNGKTALMIAIENYENEYSHKIINILIQESDISIKDNNKNTAKDYVYIKDLKHIKI